MFTGETKKRFKNPRNAGDLLGCNAEGCANGEDCSDYIVVKLQIEKEVIKKAKFQVYGCPGAICTADIFIDLITNQSVKEALAVDEKKVVEALGVFPEEYLHCARLPITAFKNAVRNYNTKIIGITGGKGGTGKSTVSTALAYELSKNYKILLVDADVDCPNDHLLLNVERQLKEKVKQRIPEWDFDKCKKCGLCSSVCKTNAIVSIKDKNPIFIPAQCNGCGACVIKCPESAIGWREKEIGKIYFGRKANIDLLTGELKTNEPISEFVVDALNDIIEKERDNYDYIIIDTAAGTHCPVIAALEVCDISFAVTEPTPLGAHDLELILRLSKKMNLKMNIVLNRSDVGNKEIIEKLSKDYQTKIVAEIPYSKDIIMKTVEGEPIHNKEINKIIEIIK